MREGPSKAAALGDVTDILHDVGVRLGIAHAEKTTHPATSGRGGGALRRSGYEDRVAVHPVQNTAAVNRKTTAQGTNFDCNAG